MLSPKHKQQVSDLWDMFWSSGMTNPLTAIEQITYLIFLKLLEESVERERLAAGKPSLYGRRPHCELDHHPQDGLGVVPLPEYDDPSYASCPGHRTCRWSYLHNLSTTTDPKTGRNITPYDHMNGYVFPWLRVLHDTLRTLNHSATEGSQMLSAPMEDAFFQFPKDKTALFQKASSAVNNLFRDISHVSASDLMGDIFEYLLSEIQTSGKNGQFRTPRHIIRFLIRLVTPQPGQKVIDPTAGTAGFLINDIQYLKQLCTSEENYVLEWDGTPHRLIRDKVSDEVWHQYMQGEYFIGYDNDRTMARIGWMNMILHGIEDPYIVLRDTLGKSLSLDESGSYDRVLANPPYTGTIDKNDLYLDIERFPKNPRKITEAITYKTELLFTWLILDLLRAGGEAAVIVPDGVLFGSTGAHKELRRQLLFNHHLKGIISLPAGIFNPYTGVKTSVLVFEKGGDTTRKGRPPRTQSVWFYEVTNDGYSLGAKREPDYTKNDLWDALYKWDQKIVDSIEYYQPNLYDARWRRVDEELCRIFPERRQFRGLLGQELGIDELFDFPEQTDPKVIEQQIVEQQRPSIASLYDRRLGATASRLARKQNSQRVIRDAFDKDLKDLDQIFRNMMDAQLEDKKEVKNNPTFGRDHLQPLYETSSKAAKDKLPEYVEQVINSTGLFALEIPDVPEVDWREQVRLIVREFAKLDGYPIKLRTHEVRKQGYPLEGSKSWSAPVRILKRIDDWQSMDGAIKGSHDEYGEVRLEYLADPSIYEDEQNNIIKKDLLDEKCIEANDYNLSAGRYKPFNPTAVNYEPPAKLIRELQELEGQITMRLGKLLEMVEGRG